MNYTQAAVIESSILQAHANLVGAVANVRIAADVARRAGLVRMAPEGEIGGFAAALDLLVLKVQNTENLIAHMHGMFEEELAEQGDVISRDRIAERKSEAEASDHEAYKRAEQQRRRIRAESARSPKDSGPE